MLACSRALFALSACAVLAASARAEDKVPIAWQGKHFTSAKFPDKFGDAPRVAVQFWEPWATKAHFRMDFDDDLRVLLLTPEKNSHAETQMKIVTRAETWFDSVLPTPDRTAVKGLEKPVVAVAKTAAPTPPPDVIPEDPESPPPGASPPPSKAPAPTPTFKMKSWGSGNTEPDRDVAVMLVLPDEKVYAGVVDMLAAAQAYLKDWAVEAKRSLGFVLEQPLSAAYIESAAGQEEWSPDHELLNHVVQLLCLRRFGQLPNWIVQGVAWEGEMAFDGAVYCFPYRSEFVHVEEHTAWPGDLRKEFKSRVDKPPKIEEVARWERGHWDGTACKLAWGLMHFAAAQGSGKLSQMLEEMRQFRDIDDRKKKSETTWERIANYEISPENQLTILKKYFGPDVMKNAGNVLRNLEEPHKGGEPRGGEPKKDEKKATSK